MAPCEECQENGLSNKSGIAQAHSQWRTKGLSHAIWRSCHRMARPTRGRADMDRDGVFNNATSFWANSVRYRRWEPMTKRLHRRRGCRDQYKTSDYWRSRSGLGEPQVREGGTYLVATRVGLLVGILSMTILGHLAFRDQFDY